MKQKKKNKVKIKSEKRRVKPTSSTNHNVGGQQLWFSLQDTHTGEKENNNDSTKSINIF
jgi:hypothetical protein